MAVNEMAQRWWFICVKNHRKTLQELSPGLYKGKPYEFYIKNFTVGADEEGIQASAQGAHLVGRAGKQTHLNHSKSTRCFGTRLATGSAAGVKGPSWYILAHQYSYITKKWLEENGAPPGSICCHNPAAYMTDDLFDEHVEEYCKGIRNMDPVIRDNPNWRLELHLDGFHSKVNTPRGQQVMRKYCMGGIQMNAHSSQDNQSFGNEPACRSKANQREW